MGTGGDSENPTHILYHEVVGPDGYATTKVPLKHIKFLNKVDLKKRINGPEARRYLHFLELIENGHYANGVPIVYRGPSGTLLASDLRHSDMVLEAELEAILPPSVPRNSVHPLICVKIIEIDSLEDIPVKRAAYLEAQ